MAVERPVLHPERKWTKWDESSTKTGEVRYNYGQRDGKWQIWDNNGQLRYLMFYQNGGKVGLWQSFNENGELENEQNFDINM